VQASSVMMEGGDGHPAPRSPWISLWLKSIQVGNFKFQFLWIPSDFPAPPNLDLIIITEDRGQDRAHPFHSN
jgi:hypothetical protein